MDFQTWFATLGICAEGYTTLSFKINAVDLKNRMPSQLLASLMQYVDTVTDGCENRFLTVGEHRNGENQLVHFHFNFAVPVFMKTSNESRRRSKFFEDYTDGKLERLSCKVDVIKSLDALENCLKYPWKERLKIDVPDYWGYNKMPKEVELYMIESAVAMFKASQELLRKKQRASERSLTLLESIEILAGQRSYSSYNEFKEYVCKEFFESLELHEYPDMSIFRKSLEKVAVKRKIVPFHYFI